MRNQYVGWAIGFLAEALPYSSFHYALKQGSMQEMLVRSRLLCEIRVLLDLEDPDYEDVPTYDEYVDLARLLGRYAYLVNHAQPISLIGKANSWQREAVRCMEELRKDDLLFPIVIVKLTGFNRP